MDVQTALEILDIATQVANGVAPTNRVVNVATLLEQIISKAAMAYEAETGQPIDLAKLIPAPIEEE